MIKTKPPAEKQIPTYKIMVQPDRLYGFTLNPAEQCYDAPNCESFIQAYSVFLIRLLRLKDIYPVIELYPEYTACKKMQMKKTSSVPRLHFHGQVQIEPFKWYTYGVTKTMEHHSYDVAEQPDIDYCKKNDSPMREWCKEWKVPYQITWKVLENKKLLARITSWYERAEKGEIRASLLDHLDD